MSLAKDDLGALESFGGPMTRSRGRKAKEALENVVASLLSLEGSRIGFEDSKNFALFCIKC